MFRVVKAQKTPLCSMENGPARASSYDGRCSIPPLLLLAPSSHKGAKMSISRTPVSRGLRSTFCTFDRRKPYLDCTGARFRDMLEIGKMISFRTPVLHGLRDASCALGTRKPWFDCTGALFRAVLEFRNAAVQGCYNVQHGTVHVQGNTAIQGCFHVQHGTVHVQGNTAVQGAIMSNMMPFTFKGILRSRVLPCPTCVHVHSREYCGPGELSCQTW